MTTNDYLPPLKLNHPRVLNTSLIISLVLVVITLVSALLLDPIKNSGMNSALSMASFAIAIFLLITNIRAHRDTDLGGYMPYGRGVIFSLLVGLITGIIMAIFTFIMYTFITPNMMSEMTNASMAEMEKQGMTEQQIEAAQNMMGAFQSPAMLAVMALFTYAILFTLFGLIISAFIKKWPRPAEAYTSTDLHTRNDFGNEL